MSGPRRDGVHTLADLKDRCRIDGQCWIWAGCVRLESARVWMPGKGVSSLSGALCKLLPEIDPGPGRILYPTCGNTLCANPKHRRPGTRSELAKLKTPRPSPATLAKMSVTRRANFYRVTPAMISEMRTSSETGTALAARFGVSISFACRVKRGTRCAPIAQSSVFSWAAAA